MGIRRSAWRQLASGVALTAVFTSAMPAFAQTPQVFFAGFSFIGNYEDNGKAFPYTTQLLEIKEPGKDTPQLDAELYRRAVAAQNPTFTLVTDRLADLKMGESLALTFGIEWENVARERLGDVYKTVVDVHGQILVFDFAEKKIISAIPVAVQVIDASRTEPNDERIMALVKDIYFGSGPAAIFDRFAERFATMPLKPSSGLRLRVGKVTLDPAAQQTVSAAGVDPAAFERTVGHSFGRSLSQNMHVAVLPYSTGESIGKKMVVRFANQEIYNLEIPEADFFVNVRLRGFKKVLLGENRVEAAWAYGTFAVITLEQPELAKRYLDDEFKYAAIKRVPRSVTSVADWAAYQESLFMLFDQITRQLAAPSEEWVSKWAAGDGVEKRLADAGKIIARCR